MKFTQDTRPWLGLRTPRGLALAAFSLAIVTLQPAAAADMSARLAQNLSPISGVTIVAKEKGFFEAHGLDITVSNFTSGKQCLNTVLGGGADIATTAEAPTTAAAMSKQPIAFLARMEYSDLKTLTRDRSRHRHSFADLKGKRIAFAAGTGSEVYTMALLEKAGLTKDDVSLTNLRPQDMLPALVAGDIDAFDIWEPFVSNAKKTLGQRRGGARHQGRLCGNLQHRRHGRLSLAENGPLVKAFLNAMIDAEAWMKDNREDAITLVAEHRRHGSARISRRSGTTTSSTSPSTRSRWTSWRRMRNGGSTPAITRRAPQMPDFSEVIDARTAARDRARPGGASRQLTGRPDAGRLTRHGPAARPRGTASGP